jgi:hypothetical protein
MEGWRGGREQARDRLVQEWTWLCGAFHLLTTFEYFAKKNLVIE